MFSRLLGRLDMHWSAMIDDLLRQVDDVNLKRVAGSSKKKKEENAAIAKL
jgi:hypothetical protein